MCCPAVPQCVLLFVYCLLNYEGWTRSHEEVNLFNYGFHPAEGAYLTRAPPPPATQPGWYRTMDQVYTYESHG